MIALKQTLQAWGGPAFNATFKKEVEALPPEHLPLQQGLSLSSSISDQPFRVMVISTGESEGRLQVKAGVFYSGIIAGCSCADDPTPQDVQAEYCDLAFNIDPQSGETTVTLLAD